MVNVQCQIRGYNTFKKIVAKTWRQPWLTYMEVFECIKHWVKFNTSTGCRLSFTTLDMITVWLRCAFCALDKRICMECFSADITISAEVWTPAEVLHKASYAMWAQVITCNGTQSSLVDLSVRQGNTTDLKIFKVIDKGAHNQVLTKTLNREEQVTFDQYWICCVALNLQDLDTLQGSCAFSFQIPVGLPPQMHPDTGSSSVMSFHSGRAHSQPYFCHPTHP